MTLRSLWNPLRNLTRALKLVHCASNHSQQMRHFQRILAKFLTVYWKCALEIRILKQILKDLNLCQTMNVRFSTSRSTFLEMDRGSMDHYGIQCLQINLSKCKTVTDVTNISEPHMWAVIRFLFSQFDVSWQKLENHRDQLIRTNKPHH